MGSRENYIKIPNYGGLLNYILSTIDQYMKILKVSFFFRPLICDRFRPFYKDKNTHEGFPVNHWSAGERNICNTVKGVLTVTEKSKRNLERILEKIK